MVEFHSREPQVWIAGKYVSESVIVFKFRDLVITDQLLDSLVLVEMAVFIGPERRTPADIWMRKPVELITFGIVAEETQVTAVIEAYTLVQRRIWDEALEASVKHIYIGVRPEVIALEKIRKGSAEHGFEVADLVAVVEGYFKSNGSGEPVLQLQKSDAFNSHVAGSVGHIFWPVGEQQEIEMRIQFATSEPDSEPSGKVSEVNGHQADCVPAAIGDRQLTLPCCGCLHAGQVRVVIQVELEINVQLQGHGFIGHQ